MTAKVPSTRNATSTASCAIKNGGSDPVGASACKAGTFSSPIVTRVDPLKGFYAAEGYHQDYLIGHPNSPYIVINDLPKVENLKRLFPDSWREQPVTVAVTQ